jgi:penicillin-binding protein-related factor A (putative recombinase)
MTAVQEDLMKWVRGYYKEDKGTQEKTTIQIQNHLHHQHPFFQKLEEYDGV